MYDFLRRVPLFADLPDDDLGRLCELVDEVTLGAGETLFAEGDAGDRAYVIKEGELEVIKLSSGRPVLLAVRTAGDVIGEIALLESVPRTASVRARSDSLLLAIHHDQLNHLLDNSPSAARAMLHTVSARSRSTASRLRQSEKMAQLGTLTAGVAHELNNPAAAVKRGASQLEGALLTMDAALAALGEVEWNPERRALADRLRLQAQAAAHHTPDLDPLARSDREYELESWLEDQGVDEPWTLAPALVELDYTPAALDELTQQFDPGDLPLVLAWHAAHYTVHDLLAEILQGASRISDIVRALKSYAYLDQAPVQEVDIHEGLDNTLLILRSKLKNIQVYREYADDLPPIHGYGSELNQVWTNLLDNAADALEGRPDARIILRTSHRQGWVTVEIEDNGPGIPPEIQNRIFDAFFTTKPPGKGTGLGLDITYNVVVNKHRGFIRPFSRPGRTCFHVLLPVDPTVAANKPPATSTAQPADDVLRSLLESTQTIAVVGMSSRPEHTSYQVPEYMQQHGFRIIPVNPEAQEILGQKAYPDLGSIGEPIDMVVIFRPSETVLPHVQEAVAVGARAVWLQEGIVNEDAAELAQSAGLEFVMDACVRATHRRLFAGAAV